MLIKLENIYLDIVGKLKQQYIKGQRLHLMSHFVLSTAEIDITTIHASREIETNIVKHVICCQYFTLKIYC